MSHVFENCEHCKAYVNLTTGHYVRGSNEDGKDIILHQSCLHYYLFAHRFLLSEEVVHESDTRYTHIRKTENP